MLKPILAVFALALSSPGFAGLLYYGGDPDGTVGLGLVSGTDGRPIVHFNISKATVYDDFVVPAGGWTLTGLGGHFATEIPTAFWLTWEIRTGMSEGVGGTLVTQGQAIPTVTPDGFDFGQTGYYVEATLPVPNYDAIELGAGTYWLGLYWNNYIRFPGTIPYIRGTSGSNAVGGPFRNGSYQDAPDFGVDFHDLAGDIGIANLDLSYRILGHSGITPMPEPGSWLLMITGLGMAVIWPRRSCRHLVAGQCPAPAAAHSRRRAALPVHPNHITRSTHGAIAPGGIMNRHLHSGLIGSALFLLSNLALGEDVQQGGKGTAFIGVFYPTITSVNLDPVRCPRPSHPVLLSFTGVAQTSLGSARFTQSHCEN